MPAASRACIRRGTSTPSGSANHSMKRRLRSWWTSSRPSQKRKRLRCWKQPVLLMGSCFTLPSASGVGWRVGRSSHPRHAGHSLGFVWRLPTDHSRMRSRVLDGTSDSHFHFSTVQRARAGGNRNSASRLHFDGNRERLPLILPCNFVNRTTYTPRLTPIDQNVGHPFKNKATLCRSLIQRTYLDGCTRPVHSNTHQCPIMHSPPHCVGALQHT